MAASFSSSCTGKASKIAEVDAVRVALELFVGRVDAGNLAGAFRRLARIRKSWAFACMASASAA